MANRSGAARNGSARRKSPDKSYEELARQNREGHKRVERSLREAKEIAKSARNGRSSSAA